MPNIFSKRLERTCHDICKVYPSCMVLMQRNLKSLRKLLSCMCAFNVSSVYVFSITTNVFSGRLPFYFQAWNSCNYDSPTWWLPFISFSSMVVLWLWLTYSVVTFHSIFKCGTKLQSFLFLDLEARSSHISPKHGLSLGSCYQHLLIMSTRLEMRPLGRCGLSLALICPWRLRNGPKFMSSLNGHLPVTTSQ